MMRTKRVWEMCVGGVLGLLLVAGPARALCSGDCDASGQVTVDELVRGVNIALGTAELETCTAFDGGDEIVTVDELVKGVNNALNGCANDGVAFVLTSDFQTGSFGTVTFDDRTVTPSSPSRSVNGDAVSRTFGGLVYVINRFQADNIQVLDPADGFATRLQCSTGNGSNPHDIVVVSPTKAYVTLYDKTDLLIVNPSAAADCSDFIIGAIDLADLADADGIPEMDQMAIVGGSLYVSVQRLDRDSVFAPADIGGLAVIDIATDEFVEEILLSGENPFAQTKGLTVVENAIVVAEVGNFGVNDGGIEQVDVIGGLADGFFVTEEALGGDITDFVLVSDSRGYAVISLPDFTNAIVAFNPTTGEVMETLPTNGVFISDIELNARGELFVADRSLTRPGVRIFRASDGQELTTAPLDLGLPPVDIVFLPAD